MKNCGLDEEIRMGDSVCERQFSCVNYIAINLENHTHKLTVGKKGKVESITILSFVRD